MDDTAHLVCVTRILTIHPNAKDDNFFFIFTEGCANGCSGHGECNRQAGELSDQEEWACTCENGFSGLDCSVQLESNCGDNIDNDKGK